jgi:hypothetical protein
MSDGGGAESSNVSLRSSSFESPGSMCTVALPGCGCSGSGGCDMRTTSLAASSSVNSPGYAGSWSSLLSPTPSATDGNNFVRTNLLKFQVECCNKRFYRPLRKLAESCLLILLLKQPTKQSNCPISLTPLCVYQTQGFVLVKQK